MPIKFDIPAALDVEQGIDEPKGTGINVLGPRLPVAHHGASTTVPAALLPQRHASPIGIELKRVGYRATCIYDDDNVYDDDNGVDGNQPVDAPVMALTGLRNRVCTLGGPARIVTEPLNGMSIQRKIPLGG